MKHSPRRGVGGRTPPMASMASRFCTLILWSRWKISFKASISEGCRSMSVMRSQSRASSDSNHGEPGMALGSSLASSSSTLKYSGTIARSFPDLRIFSMPDMYSRFLLAKAESSE